MKAYRIQTFFITLVFIFFVIDCPAQVKNDSSIIKLDSLQLSDSINPDNYQDKNHTTTLDFFLKKINILMLQQHPFL